MQPHFGFGTRIVSLMRIMILLLCMSSIAALVMARVSDRRWRALFILSIACIAVLTIMMKVIIYMGPVQDLLNEGSSRLLVQVFAFFVGGTVLSALGLL